MDPVTERTKKLTLKTHHSFPLQHKILDCKKWRIMLLQNLICIRILIWGEQKSNCQFAVLEFVNKRCYKKVQITKLCDEIKSAWSRNERESESGLFSPARLSRQSFFNVILVISGKELESKRIFLSQSNALPLTLEKFR